MEEADKLAVTPSEANLEGAAGKPAEVALSASTGSLGAVDASGGDQDVLPQDAPDNEGNRRDVAYESAAQFAFRHNIPVNRLRELNPGCLSDDGRILVGRLTIM